MFTGLIEEVGRVGQVKKGAKSLELTIYGQKIFSDLRIGDSVAVNGVCLTVTTFGSNYFTAHVMPESVGMTTLPRLGPNSPVNLERAMSAAGRFGGHMVAGHVDGTGRIIDIKKVDSSTVFRIEADSSLLEYIIYKGSIAIDGASLTVSHVGPTYFEVSIIPHTMQETILYHGQVGTQVNLETDIFGRYVKHFMTFQGPEKESKQGESSVVTKELLMTQGFL